jgi:REP-associated tyrosine transposase
MANVTRRRLPHWYMPGAVHFVTFRLTNTLPRHVLNHLRERRQTLLDRPRPEGQPIADHRIAVNKLLFAEYDRFLDNHRDVHWLDDPRVAALVRSSLHYLHERKYHLFAYCVMPNHVHAIFQPNPDEARRPDEAPVGETEDARSPLAGIMHSLKSYTAHEANKLLGRSGQFWQHESYDHWVRDEEELERIVRYVNANPVAAGLAARPEDWFWGSAHERYVTDGDVSGWLVFS